VLRTALLSHPITLSAYVALAQEHLAPTDTFTAVSSSSDGSHGLFELSMGAPINSRSEDVLKITGKDGWIDVIDAEDYRVVLHTTTKEGENEQVFEFKSQGVEKELEYFVDTVNGGKGEGIGDPREALRDVAFIEAGLKSKGEKVDLERLVREGK
jgi:predicted dehydrogenase